MQLMLRNAIRVLSVMLALSAFLLITPARATSRVDMTPLQQCQADLGSQKILTAQANESVRSLTASVNAAQGTINALLQNAAQGVGAQLDKELKVLEKDLVTGLGGTWKDDGTGDRFDWTTKTVKKATPATPPLPTR